MRKIMSERDLFSPPDIGNIRLPDKKRASRLTLIFYGLRELYLSREDLIKKVFEDLARDKDAAKGREGMNAWRTLVLYALKTGLDQSYDMVADLARNHKLLRDMMGVSKLENFAPTYSTIHQNIMLLRKDTIDQINPALVDISIKKGFEDGKQVRGDSFVCQTNIHYPTDLSLVLDGCRKVIDLCVEFSDGEDGWRQHKYLYKKAKRLKRKIEFIKRSKRPEEVKENILKKAVGEYLKFVRRIIDKALDFLSAREIGQTELGLFTQKVDKESVTQIFHFLGGTEYMCNLVERRLLKGEDIENKDKIYSLFETHTELINRGKFPNPIEFGHRVFLGQGRSGMILSHQVMGIGVTDDKILESVLRELYERFQHKLEVASFDKGFYTPANLINAREYCELVVIPKKGHLTNEYREIQSSKEYLKFRHWRSGIESLISAMVRTNGMLRCPDKTYRGYKKFISSCVLARNLQTLGMLLMVEAQKKQKKKSA